jgi:hypothetical protein
VNWARLVSVPLRDMPNLRHAVLEGRPGEGRLDLTGGSGVAGALTSLQIGILAEVAFDFTATPALRQLSLEMPAQLAGLETVSAAQGLECLALHNAASASGLAVQLLRSLPLSVRGLAVVGPKLDQWDSELAAAVGSLSQLRALALVSTYTSSRTPFPLPPAGAPVWRGLKTFYVHQIPFLQVSTYVPNAVAELERVPLVQHATYILPGSTPRTRIIERDAQILITCQLNHYATHVEAVGALL